MQFKRKFYQSIKGSFEPDFCMLYGTLHGYRMCKDDPQTIDYDYICLQAKADNGDEVWIEFMSDAKIHVIVRLGDFNITYFYGDKYVDIENAKPSFRDNLDKGQQELFSKIFLEIEQAVVEARK